MGGGASYVCSRLLPWGWTRWTLPTELPDGKPSVLRGSPSASGRQARALLPMLLDTW